MKHIFVVVLSGLWAQWLLFSWNTIYYLSKELVPVVIHTRMGGIYFMGKEVFVTSKKTTECLLPVITFELSSTMASRDSFSIPKYLSNETSGDINKCCFFLILCNKCVKDWEVCEAESMVRYHA